jgi:N-acetylglucosamine kinase
MYYGFDIGGTKIALGVFDKDLKLQWETRVPTPRESYDEFLTAIAALVAQADERFGVKGSVGIGIPGMPETDDGTLYAANVPAASGKPLRADLSALLERDVRLDNDANCFALSEAWDDEFRQYPLVMGLILGTGVGGESSSTVSPSPGAATSPASLVISACRWMRWRSWGVISR